jgi:diadenosine tetraphosphatase ApaH/serine/threonine PP2A family protein phosphatase
MRLLLLADVHGNLEALEAVLGDAATRGFDETLFLGDAVGYGASSGEVVARLRALTPRGVMGNHEQMLLSGLRNARFSDTPVGQALKLASTQVSADDLEWLRAWKQGVRVPIGNVEAFFVHGSPRDPNEYVDNLGAARGAFTDWQGKLAFVGHAHIAGVYAALDRDTKNVRFTPFLDAVNRLAMPPRGRWIVNPGSVGQPRDGDARASYGIFDFGRNALEVYRVAYDIAGAQRRIREAGLPDALATRLSVGK